MIEKVAIAQERYRAEHGEYYTLASPITNETKISRDLQVDLKISNNFMYAIFQDNDNYIIKAMLRFNNGTCDNDIYYCKQIGTPNKNAWVDDYNTAADNHYIRFKYPDSFTSGKADYFDNSKINKGD